MDYARVASAYGKIERSKKRLEMTDILANLFKKTSPEIIEKVVYLTQGKLYPDFLGVEIGIADKLAIRAIANASALSPDQIEKEYQKSGDLGEAARIALLKKIAAPLFPQPLTVERVYTTLEEMARITGSGSQDSKLGRMVYLFADATPEESKYIVRTITGRLRLGIADYTVLDALSIAFTGDKSNRKKLERAYNRSSDLGLVAKRVAETGLAGISKFRVKTGNPIRPMLAERLTSASEIIEKLGGEVAAEYKLDGERLQIHIDPKNVRIFSRKLENITSHYPEVADICRMGMDAKRVIIEGEAVAIDLITGDYLPFQELMHRRRKYEIDKVVEQYPISLNLFDILFIDGRDLTSLPYKKRRQMLEAVAKKGERLKLVEQIVSEDPNRIETFMDQALSDGSEGLVIKNLNGNYRAGAREFLWIKLKPEYNSDLSDTFDLVVVGGLYGRGRRVGRYGALLLAAYDRDEGRFKSFCKVGTGFSDENLQRIHDVLKEIRLKEKHSKVDSDMVVDVWFEPKMILEVSGSEITRSPIHMVYRNASGKGVGLALRFPKFTGRIRDDKRSEDATTTDEIVAMYRSQVKKISI